MGLTFDLAPGLVWQAIDCWDSCKFLKPVESVLAHRLHSFRIECFKELKSMVQHGADLGIRLRDASMKSCPCNVHNIAKPAAQCITGRRKWMGCQFCHVRVMLKARPWRSIGSGTRLRRLEGTLSPVFCLEPLHFQPENTCRC